MKIKFLFIVAGLAAAFAAWWLVSPLLLDDVVEEDLPEEIATIEDFDRELGMPSEDEMKEMNDVEMEEMEKKMQEKALKMADVVVVDPVIEVNDSLEQKEVAEVRAPLLLAKGEFRDGDSFHQGSGKVFVYQQADGTKLLRLEDFEVTNGPDLFVYLAKDLDQKGDFYNVARLKGNKGSQNYVIPADVDVADYQSVIVYCRAFSVLFSVAGLE